MKFYDCVSSTDNVLLFCLTHISDINLKLSKYRENLAVTLDVIFPLLQFPYFSNEVKDCTLSVPNEVRLYYD